MFLGDLKGQQNAGYHWETFQKQKSESYFATKFGAPTADIVLTVIFVDSDCL